MAAITTVESSVITVFTDVEVAADFLAYLAEDPFKFGAGVVIEIVRHFGAYQLQIVVGFLALNS